MNAINSSTIIQFTVTHSVTTNFNMIRSSRRGKKLSTLLSCVALSLAVVLPSPSAYPSGSMNIDGKNWYDSDTCTPFNIFIVLSTHKETHIYVILG